MNAPAICSNSPCIPDQDKNAQSLLKRFVHVRGQSLALTRHLTEEDMVVQSMPDASPAKWHLAHTTWFFETFILAEQLAAYQEFDSRFSYLFNSYYEAVGPRQPRPMRGVLTRPTLSQVLEYRHAIDQQIAELLSGSLEPAVVARIELGLAHEEQHQELLVMDILHLFSQSPLKPVMESAWQPLKSGRPGQYRHSDGGLIWIGASAEHFSFDNESPRHQVWLAPFAISDRLITNGEWISFINGGGYQQAQYWLSDGWAQCQAEEWQAPMYWENIGGRWCQMTPAGMQPLDPNTPVIHISHYEADAFARWSGARLPTEQEWEHASHTLKLDQLYDAAWQWTATAYSAYPGFKSADGAIGEYNGKFMSSQIVLRGGSFATPPNHSRPAYRNFYRPGQRWMFSGVRLARDVSANTVAPDQDFPADVLAGLSTSQKTLSPKYFYDDVGSALFESICATDEYYPTRTEVQLLKEMAGELATGLKDNTVLLELGSGASIKTRIVLDAAQQIQTYVPIDISADALKDAASRIHADYPRLTVISQLADFTRDIVIPDSIRDRPVLAFFPGSTIGNFEPEQAVELLQSLRQRLKPGDALLMGADLVKDVGTLHAAYNDKAGITAAFNRNILARINRELQGNFDPDLFAHEARWNSAHSRIEMHLVSSKAQSVEVVGRTFSFEAGESIHTENSHKFTVESIKALAGDTGWSLERQWISSGPAFGLFLLRNRNDAGIRS